MIPNASRPATLRTSLPIACFIALGHFLRVRRQVLAVVLVAFILSQPFILKFAQSVLADTSTPVSIPAFGTAVTENFDTLSSSTASSTTPQGWGFVESGTGANTTYSAGTGSNNTGDTYSFGATGNTERAFGSLQSGSLVPIIGATFTNNTGGTITSLAISYTGEQWRLGSTGRTDRLDFQISTNATSLTTGTYTDVDSLDFNGPISTGTVGALDGNAPANRTAISNTISGLNISNGGTFWLRWTDLNAAGADDGLAVDDFSLTASGTVADTAPSVNSTDPLNNAIDVAANANITITFSEPVNVTGNWFQIACNTSGTRQVIDTGVTGGPTTFVIDPTNDFAFNEVCTVTVYAAQVSDQDSNDPPDNMTADATFSFTTTGPPASPGSVLISQVYGGGGNSGAPLTNDFIELKNPGMSAISLNGWSVQYGAATGTSWQVTPLTSVTLQPGQYYLIQESGTGTSTLPAPDATGTINMSATAGKVALVNSTTALTGTGCPFSNHVVDFVGFGGTANCSEGSGPTPAPSNTNAVLRANNGCSDTNNNAADFATGAPNPHNTATTPSVCGTPTDPSATGTANPNNLAAGDDSQLTVNVTPGTNPTSSSIIVTADLSAIGGSNPQVFTSNGNSFTFLATVSGATTPGQKSLPVTVSDAEGRSGSTTITLTVQQPPPPANHIVISQVYGGGGNADATYTNDFIELYNPGSIAFDLTGWTLQYASATGSGWDSNKQPLGGSIAAGEYYLVSLGSGGAVGAAMPPANISGQINMAAGTGKIALVSNGESLSGTCPIGDPDLVDFVGYGSSPTTTNFCFEGSANAPAGGNSTAVIRRNGGDTDTNQNRNDFLSGTPNPRRTAPIVELGPWVSSTDPSTNDTLIPHDASMTISFSESVDVVGAWYNINCVNTGLHNDATVAHTSDFKTYVITPNTNFQFGEQCTVTINKTAVHDQDLDDGAPNTDTLFEDYVWTFTVVGAGAPAPYPPSVHLTMGNPSNAVADISQPNNYLMEKPTYTLSYNRDKGTPNWVSWHLDTSWFGSLMRVDTFRPDPAVPPDWYRVQATDFFSTGFDRGHMTPNADRDNENRIPINQETYLMSNMVPQAPDNNQGPWANLENDLRSILTTGGENEIYIVSGPLGVGGSGSNGGTTTTVAGGNVTVPAYTWKVALVLSKGDDDVSRVRASSRTIAILMPNTQGIRNVPWQNYLTTVDNIEALTGYDFFANVPDAIENSIEAGTNGVNPPGTEGQAVTTAEDTSKNITLTAVSANGNPLSYSIVSSPTHGILTGNAENRSYAPESNYNGADSFSFKVNDGTRDSNVSTVNITVTAVNDAPVAGADNYATNSNTTLNVAAPGVLANDSDIDSPVLSAVIVSDSGPNHGSLTLNTNGSFSYIPAQNYTGPDSFSYRAFDGTDYSNAATVSLTVNDTVPPVLTSSVAMALLSTTNSSLINVGLTASATDNSGGPVAIDVAVFGDEDDQTPTANNIVHSPDAKDIAPGTLRLRGERIEANDGRVYLIVVKATDSAGNISRNYHTVVVPKSNKQANIDAVNAQAAAAASYAQAHEGVPPSGYFVIGDGPIIGPKQ